MISWDKGVISGEECSGSSLHVNSATDRLEIKVCETHRGEGKKTGGVNRKQRRGREGGGEGGGLLILSFLRPFSRSKRQSRGYHLTLRFTSLPSECDSNNAKCAKT